MPIAVNNYSVADHLDERVLEAGRLASFDADWPHPDESRCSRLNMAKAGFYYTGKQDLVKCFACQLKLADWDAESDDPWKKHREFASGCEFAKLNKEEGELTVEQWIDVACNRALNKVNRLLDSLIEQ